MKRPKVYTASKIYRAAAWRVFREMHSDLFEFTSSWVLDNEIEKNDGDPDACKRGWVKNIEDVVKSDYLIAWASPDDELSGTLVEIGAALALTTKVILVGECKRFSTWQHHPQVIGQFTTLEEALLCILRIERSKL